jgi:hypothetical protein
VPAPAPAAVLTRRDLNRALLARQLLLARADRTVVSALEGVAGLQAQLARPPFIGLWTRLKGFDRTALLDALVARTVVRVTAMRGTLFLLSAHDYLALRGALQPGLTRGLQAITGGALKDTDLAAAEARTRAFLARAPATFEAIRDHLADRAGTGNVRHLAYALRMTLPLVQVPDPDLTWGFPGAASFALADGWLKRKVSTTTSAPETLVRRYLAAFGPASVADAQTWSGVPKLAEVFERLRKDLVTFRDERKRELFDVPEGPRPAAEVAAPIRFVPDWDNVLLGHQDRSRIIADEHRSRISTRNLQVLATFLIDGMVAGSWSIARTSKAATLTMVPFVKVGRTDRAALEEEGERLLAFAEPDRKVRNTVIL